MRRRRDTAAHLFFSPAFCCKRLFGSLVLADLWFGHFLDMLWFAGVGVVLVLAFSCFFCLLSPCSRKAKKQSKVVPGRPCCVACCVASCVACCVAWRCVALRGALHCVAWLLCAVRWFVALLKADFVFMMISGQFWGLGGSKMEPKWLQKNDVLPHLAKIFSLKRSFRRVKKEVSTFAKST